VALQVLGRAAHDEPAQRAVAAGSDEEDVDVLTERRELLAGEAEDDAALHIRDLPDALGGVLEHDVDTLADRREHACI
jgi:hypothetical protein